MHVNPSDTNLKLVSKSLAPISFLVGEPEVTHIPPHVNMYPTIDRKLLEMTIEAAIALGLKPGAVVLETNKARNKNMIISPFNWGIITSFKRYEIITESRCIQVSWIACPPDSRTKAHTAEELILIYPVTDDKQVHEFVTTQLADRSL